MNYKIMRKLVVPSTRWEAANVCWWAFVYNLSDSCSLPSPLGYSGFANKYNQSFFEYDVWFELCCTLETGRSLMSPLEFACTPYFPIQVLNCACLIADLSSEHNLFRKLQRFEVKLLQEHYFLRNSLEMTASHLSLKTSAFIVHLFLVLN